MPRLFHPGSLYRFQSERYCVFIFIAADLFADQVCYFVGYTLPKGSAHGVYQKDNAFLQNGNNKNLPVSNRHKLLLAYQFRPFAEAFKTNNRSFHG